jgi:putative transposase
MKKRVSEVQIIGFLREAEAGVAVKDLCRRHGFSEASYYLWRSKFGGLTVSDARRLKALEQENARLKKLLAETRLEQAVTQEVLRKKWYAHRLVGRWCAGCVGEASPSGVP